MEGKREVVKSYKLGSERADRFSHNGQQAVRMRGNTVPQRNVGFSRVSRQACLGFLLVSEEKVGMEKKERYAFYLSFRKKGQT